MKRLLFIFLSLSQACWASECFTEHISEALRQNRQRKALYGALSNDKSHVVSDAFILSEEISYVYAAWMMFRTKDLRRSGIPILCSEFTPMSLSPKFKPTFGPGPGPLLSEYQAEPLRQIADELGPYIEALDFEQIKAVSLKWALLSYQREPRFNCMSRHILESIYATAEVSKKNLRTAEKVGKVKKTKRYIKKFLDSQLFGLTTVSDIDKKASKIQAMNIPIVCNDVPAILDLEKLK